MENTNIENKVDTCEMETKGVYTYCAKCKWARAFLTTQPECQINKDKG